MCNGIWSLGEICGLALSRVLNRTYKSQQVADSRSSELLENRPGAQTMDSLRTDIWDHLYRSGPKTAEQIASHLRVDVDTVVTIIQHDWFEVMDSKVRIASRLPPSETKGLVG